MPSPTTGRTILSSISSRGLWIPRPGLTSPEPFIFSYFILRLKASFLLPLCSPYVLPLPNSLFILAYMSMRAESILYSQSLGVPKTLLTLQGIPSTLHNTVECPEKGLLGLPAAALMYILTRSSAIHWKHTSLFRSLSRTQKRPLSPPHYKFRDISLHH